MAIIHELDPHVINLIAAGEVVERPASVVKELIENAIDAGATRITVEIEGSGTPYLRVTDNGCGMSKEDAPVAFHRHATSKLRAKEDLEAIHTLGFRGEALAAIAAVSQIDLLTKQQGNLAGTHIHINGGKVEVVEEAGCPEGTTIVIRNLFFNTPARMKFLKKDYTEAGYVVANAQQQALSHPEIAFTVLKDNKQVFASDGKGKLLTPVFSVFGRELSQNMLQTELWEKEGYSAHGVITKPHACRPNRSLQHFFVNGRFVRSRVIQAAMEEAYRHSMITGKHPSGCLFITVPPSQVDVNVHPAKTEVKFAVEKRVFEAVYATCKNALDANDNTPQIKAQSFAPVVPSAVFAKPQTSMAQVQSTMAQEPKALAVPEISLDELMGEIPEGKIEALPIPPAPSAPLAPDVPRFFGEKRKQTHEERVAETREILRIKPKEVVPPPELVAQVKSMIGKDGKCADIKKLNQVLREAAYKIYAIQDGEQVNGGPLPSKNEPVPTTAPQPVLDEIKKFFPAGLDLPIVEFAPIPSFDEHLREKALGSVRIIGEAFQTYIVAEDAEGIVLVDKHAAHERILFNRLRAETEVTKQTLLTMTVADVSPVQFATLCENAEVLDTLGFEIEPFGNNCIGVRTVPSYLQKDDVDAVLSEIADKLQQGRAPTPDRLDDLVHSISCRAAIKAGKNTETEELRKLCETVMDDPEVHSCPHGRPVMVRLTKYEIDKMFKRVNQ